MSNSIPGTICCILCRRLINYKDGDKQRFKTHLANEHSAFFDVDYLLASCFLEPAQKEAMAMSVNKVTSSYIRNQLDAEDNNSNEQETLRETTIAAADVEQTTGMSNLFLNDRKKLPNEVLVQIFSHLEISTLNKAGEVCKRWSEVVQVIHDKAWRKLTTAVKLDQSTKEEV